MRAVKGKETAVESEQAVFTKKQLLASSRYKGKGDLLEALLEDGKMYSFQETDETIDFYMKGKVN